MWQKEKNIDLLQTPTDELLLNRLNWKPEMYFFQNNMQNGFQAEWNAYPAAEFD